MFVIVNWLKIQVTNIIGHMAAKSANCGFIRK
jgi:hypothetical protein